MATFSVVVPAYRSAPIIASALDSIALQHHAPLEVIVVDDASGDLTEQAVETCRAALDARGTALHFIGLGVNGGPSAARNAGMSAAQGTHVAFLDADDTWHPAKLAVVHHHLAACPAAGMVFHTYAVGEQLAEPVPAALGYVAHATSAWTFLCRNVAQTSCVVIRNEPAFLFDERMRYCEDHDLWLRIVESPRPAIQLIGPPLTLLSRPQLSAGGLSANRSRMRRGELTAYYNYCSRHWLPRAALLPLLTLFSFGKHLRSTWRHIRTARATGE